MAIGFGLSLFLVTTDILIVEDRVRGLRLDLENVFRWDKVILILPGMEDYNPSRPWVFKVRKDGTLVADILFYTDDGTPTTSSA